MLSNKEWDIISLLSDSSSRASSFIGDDTALLENEKMLITTDHMVEGVHFDLSFMSPESVGWRLMAANASDIIAMGGTPETFLLNIAIPKDHYEIAKKIITGINNFAYRYNITVIGGDTTSSSQFFIGVTMLGHTGDSIWKRSSAQSGDIVSIAHYPGLSHAGLLHLQANSPGFDESKEHFLFPDPFGYIPFAGRIHAAIDISDSLISELTLLARASHKSITINLDEIPRHEEVLKTADIFQIPLTDLLLGSGEEFFLITTSPEEIPGFFQIGFVTDVTDKDVIIYDKTGAIDPASISRFTHFSS